MKISVYTNEAFYYFNEYDQIYFIYCNLDSTTATVTITSTSRNHFVMSHNAISSKLVLFLDVPNANITGYNP